MDNYEIFVYSWIIIGIISFPFILKYDAPYGRHTSNKWGPLIDNKIAWIVMELPALMVCPLIVFNSDNAVSDVTMFFIILWAIHYFNRSVIFPLRIKTKPYLINGCPFLSFHKQAMINRVKITVMINSTFFPPGNESPKAIPSFVMYVK